MTQLARAWKDPDYRALLADSDLAALGANPAGVIDIEDHSLDSVVGGTLVTLTIPSCRTCLTCHSSCSTCFTCSGWPCS